MDILYILKAIILGVVEGLTEFLPISSTGHLIIVGKLTAFPEDSFSVMFMIVVQLAAIFAVLVYFWERFFARIKGFFTGNKADIRFCLLWTLACIPAVVAGLLFDDYIETHLMSIPTVIAALLVGAVLLLILEKYVAPKAVILKMEDLRLKDALSVGFAQCLALWPGFSRSASTIMGAWGSGLSTRAGADFSFFLAIPIMFGASAYALVKFLKRAMHATIASEGLSQMMDATHILALILGCLTSYFVALAVVRGFMEFLKNHKLAIFAYYRIGLALVLLILLGLGIV